MNEDNAPKPQGAINSADAIEPEESETERVSERVFDISEDNIVPIEDVPDTVQEKTGQPIKIPIPKIASPLIKTVPRANTAPAMKVVVPIKPKTPPVTTAYASQIKPPISASNIPPASQVKPQSLPTKVSPPFQTLEKAAPAIPKTSPVIQKPVPANQNIYAPVQKPAAVSQNIFAPAQPSPPAIQNVTVPIQKVPVPVQKPIETAPKPFVVAQKTAPAIPLQDFSDSLLKARSEPMSQPAKIMTSEEFRRGRVGNIQTGQISSPQPASRPQIRPLGASVPVNITPVSELSLKYEKEISKEKEPENLDIRPIRTYETDVADALSRTRTSTASIAIAESRKSQGEDSIGNAPPSHAGRKIFLIVLSLVLIGAGAIGAYYLYSISPLAPVASVVNPQKIITSLVPSDANAIITIDNMTASQIQTAIQNEVAKAQAPNTLKEIILAKKSGAQSVRVGAPEMLQIMDIAPPDILSRSLTADWMLGEYADAQGRKNIFIVAATDFFQNTFAGMLQWESVMADDLKLYLYPATTPFGIANAPAVTPPIVATTTSTSSLTSIGTSTRNSTGTRVSTSTISTPASASTTDFVQPFFTIRGQFEDRIVKNKDVREFRTSAGNILFLYSFIDTTRLVVAGNESTLSEILTRLEKQSFVR